MAKGDYDWAVQEIAKEVGDRFYSDGIGLNTLHMALYEGGAHGEGPYGHKLSPDLQAAAYHSFQEYMIEEYEWDWEDNFDWDSYRDWYE